MSSFSTVSPFHQRTLSNIPQSSSSTPQLDDRRSSSPSTESSSLSSRPNTPMSLDDYGPILALEKDFCSNFSCCGLTLPDMHALLDHFEESHVVVLGEDGRPVYPTPPSPSRTHAASSVETESPYDRYHPHLAGCSSSRAPVASIVIDYPKPFPPATPGAYQLPRSPFHDFQECGLGLYDSATDPFELEPKGTYPDIADPYDPFGFEANRALRVDFDPSSSASPSSSSGFSTFDNASVSTLSSPATSAFPSPSSKPVCLPPALLTLPKGASSSDQNVPYYFQGTSRPQSPESLLPSISRIRPATSPAPTPTPSQSPPPAQPTFRTYYPPHISSALSTPSKVKAKLLDSPSTTTASLKLSGRRRDRLEREKAFKCPNALCTKRYLNPNGLKYHMEKGTCTAPGPRPWQGAPTHVV